MNTPMMVDRNRGMRSLFTISNILLFFLAGTIEATKRNQFASYSTHRIFPAAKKESYNPDSLPSILGLLTGNNITFTTSLMSKLNKSTADANASIANENATISDDRNTITKIDDFLRPAMLRFKNSLKRLPDFSDDYPVNPSGLPLVPISSSIVIALRSSDLNLYHGVPEDYELRISIEQNTVPRSETIHDSTEARKNDTYVNYLAIVSIQASTVFGVLRAIETLGQLLEFGWVEKKGRIHSSASPGVFIVRDLPVHISDAPAFPYRGLMIDTARHYLPMDLILDNLDAMAMNKMNVLHWHISDSQSFPYSPSNQPELAAKGAYHPKRIYKPADVQNLIKEAYLRGIRVIPEIDMPGHTNAIAASHPEVMSHCPHPSEPMNPTVPETYEFIREVYQDLSDVFPDKMVHLGGDEVQLSEACWLKDPAIAKWMKDHGMGNKTVELYEYFETHLLRTISNFQKTPIVWQEVFNLNLTIPADAIIDVWKGFDIYTIQNATNAGHRVILSGCWYMDHLDQTWEKFYTCDPLNFTSPNKHLMMGGHASMWGEHVDASNFLSRVWPRASSTAEKLWHGSGPAAKDAAATIRDRIHRFRCHMVRMGFPAGPTGPGVCPTEVGYAGKNQRECSMRQGPRCSDRCTGVDNDDSIGYARGAASQS